MRGCFIGVACLAMVHLVAVYRLTGCPLRLGKISEALSLQSTLASELTQAHPLFLKQPKVFGRCIANDDVVAVLNDGRIAVIHLTWKGKPDQYPDKYPPWGCFSTVEAFNKAIGDDEEDEDL